MNVEKVYHAAPDGGEGLLALVIRPESPYPDGCHFATPADAALQVGLMRRKAGHLIEAHTHPLTERRIYGTPEVLYVRNGMIRADFYSSAGDYAESHHLGAGDVLVLLAGGHGIYFARESEILECKLGPFTEGADKVYLSSGVGK